jgi:predicted RNase H-like HicB family nuclease
MNYKFNTVIEKDEHGYYAFCPELEGCHTQGDTLEEVLDNIREAISLYIETLTAEEIQELASKQVLSTTVEVQVA